MVFPLSGRRDSQHPAMLPMRPRHSGHERRLDRVPRPKARTESIERVLCTEPLGESIVLEISRWRDWLFLRKLRDGQQTIFFRFCREELEHIDRAIAHSRQPGARTKSLRSIALPNDCFIEISAGAGVVLFGLRNARGAIVSNTLGIRGASIEVLERAVTEFRNEAPWGAEGK